MYKVEKLSYQSKTEASPRIGKLVYRHSKGYFITLEFNGAEGKFKESFYSDEVKEL